MAAGRSALLLGGDHRPAHTDRTDQEKAQPMDDEDLASAKAAWAEAQREAHAKNRSKRKSIAAASSRPEASKTLPWMLETVMDDAEGVKLLRCAQ